MLEQIKENWQDILTYIKTQYEITDVAFKMWFLPISVKEINGNKLILVVDDSIIGSTGADHIKKKYELFIKVGIAEKTGREFDLEFILKSQDINNSSSSSSSKSFDAAKNSNLNTNYTFDTFVTGSNNSIAQAAALAVAEMPGESYNPFFIYGGVGLGKTHLMHAIGHYALEQNNNLKVLYVTSEKFTNEVIQSIRNKTSDEFRNKYRNVDILLIDDIQFIVDKERTQEEFFHTFNALYESKKQIIITSDRPPKEMKNLEARLVSRFEQGLMVDISIPDYETRYAILEKKTEINGLRVEKEILQYIAENITSNIRELEGSLNKVVALSRLKKTPITIDLAKEAIKDLIDTSNQHKVNLSYIVDMVADQYSLTTQEIYSKNRSGKIAYARQVAMYLCKKYLDMSFTDIGKDIGNRDHTTVMHGYKKIEDDIKSDPAVAQKIEVLVKKMNLG